MVHLCALAGAVASALVLLATPALAQSTNAAPVIVNSSTPLDVGKLPLSDEGKKSISDTIAKLNAGTVFSAVYAGGLDGRTWQVTLYDGGTPQTVQDLARQTLERCEFFEKGPCVIFMINGHEARSPDGGWPTQPRMLAQEPGAKFDPWTVPFIPLAGRGSITGYLTAPSPKALTVTPEGFWNWSVGKSAIEAVDTAGANCTKQNVGHVCLLYAVNDTVVIAP